MHTQGARGVNGLLVRSAVAPLLAAPSLRSEMVSQLVLGEGAEILEARGNMRRVRAALDGYEGWIHRGYTVELDWSDVEAWLRDANWSEGAVVEDDHGVMTKAHHRARLRLQGARVELPDGSKASIASGRIRPMAAVTAEAVSEPPADWAWRVFAGTPYLWGGVTTAGIDCSALVQTTFLARGVALPRDAREQVALGQQVEIAERRAGDLLFFRDTEGDAISHVAILAGHETIVHSTVSAGQVVRESWADGETIAALKNRLVAVRRHP
jgi:hypothetical protein